MKLLLPKGTILELPKRNLKEGSFYVTTQDILVDEDDIMEVKQEENEDDITRH